MEIILGGHTLKEPNVEDTRFAQLLWGPAGCGKTTLASTAPGKKMWILFDMDGTASLNGRNAIHDDILVLDLSGEKHLALVEKMKAEDPYGIEAMLIKHQEIETVVFDSATAYVISATENAVHHVKSATLENPGLKGYGHRNAVVLRAITTIMRLTKRQKRNIIIISHEDTADKNENGTVNFITLALGGKMVNQLGLQLSEIWWMQDTGTERRIAVRPARTRTPMKTRMFDASKGAEFVWKYDAENWKGDGIGTWFEAWKASGGRKISLPK